MKVLYALAATIYLLLLASLIVVVSIVDDSDSMIMALYALSTAMMMFTIIFALLFMRETRTDQYKKYLEEKQSENSDWEKNE